LGVFFVNLFLPSPPCPGAAVPPIMYLEEMVSHKHRMEAIKPVVRLEAPWRHAPVRACGEGGGGVFLSRLGAVRKGEGDPSPPPSSLPSSGE